jgi:tRNA (guanine37-N1)-methyltransferase
MLQFKVFSIFPQAFPGVLGISLCGKAFLEEKWNLKTIDIKNFATDKHKTVDDAPFGGGAGMLMRADVLGKAIESELKLEGEPPIILLTSARGRLFNQKFASQLSKSSNSIYIICGRFEGVDQRFVDFYKATEVSLGPFVLFGGEVAAMAIVESAVRLLPGVVGNEQTTREESFSVGTEFEDLVEYPQYTKPREWNGLCVPEVLLSGDHKKIANWRLEQAQKATNAVKLLQQNSSSK